VSGFPEFQELKCVKGEQEVGTSSGSRSNLEKKKIKGKSIGWEDAHERPRRVSDRDKGKKKKIGGRRLTRTKNKPRRDLFRRT